VIATNIEETQLPTMAIPRDGFRKGLGTCRSELVAFQIEDLEGTTWTYAGR
jgi:hypothetical protein